MVLSVLLALPMGAWFRLPLFLEALDRRSLDDLLEVLMHQPEGPSIGLSFVGAAVLIPLTWLGWNVARGRHSDDVCAAHSVIVAGLCYGFIPLVLAFRSAGPYRYRDLRRVGGWWGRGGMAGGHAQRFVGDCGRHRQCGGGDCWGLRQASPVRRV